MADLSVKSGQDLKREDDDRPETLPNSQERNSVFCRLRDMFKQQFDDEIISCVAANFGWNEQESIKALLMLASDNLHSEETRNGESTSDNCVTQKNGLGDNLTHNKTTNQRHNMFGSSYCGEKLEILDSEIHRDCAVEEGNISARDTNDKCDTKEGLSPLVSVPSVSKTDTTYHKHGLINDSGRNYVLKEERGGDLYDVSGSVLQREDRHNFFKTSTSFSNFTFKSETVTDKKIIESSLPSTEENCFQQATNSAAGGKLNSLPNWPNSYQDVPSFFPVNKASGMSSKQCYKWPGSTASKCDVSTFLNNKKFGHRIGSLPLTDSQQKEKVFYHGPNVESKEDKAQILNSENGARIVRVSQLQSLFNRTIPKGRRDRVKGTIKNSLGSKIDRIANGIIDGKKILVLMRGLPGSGKSTLARYLIQSTTGGEPRKHIYSTDNFFIACGKGKYKFEPTLLSEAHSWNLKRVMDAAERGVTPIVVDNTNLEEFEMRPYAAVALHYKYQLEFLEPNTQWRYVVEECARRNTHGVPVQQVAKMMLRFDRSITASQLTNRRQLRVDMVPYLQTHCIASKLVSSRKRKRKRNKPKKQPKISMSKSKTDDSGNIVHGGRILNSLTNEAVVNSVACRLANLVVPDDGDSLSKSDNATGPNSLFCNHSILEDSTENIKKSDVNPLSLVTEQNSDESGDISNMHNITKENTSLMSDFVPISENSFVYEKTHNLPEFKSDPQLKLMVKNKNKTCKGMAELLENDSAQLNFNMNQQENSLIEAMDSEDAPKMSTSNLDTEDLSDVKKLHDSVTQVEQLANGASEDELLLIHTAKNGDMSVECKVSGHPVSSENSSKYSIESNHVMWDLEHGNVWGSDSVKLAMNSKNVEGHFVPKPPRKHKKRLPVKDFIEESLQHLTHTSKHLPSEIDQWDSVEDPVTSWENHSVKRNSPQNFRDEHKLFAATLDGYQKSFEPQPQRQSTARLRFQRSSSESPRRTQNEQLITRPDRASSADCSKTNVSDCVDTALYNMVVLQQSTNQDQMKPDIYSAKHDNLDLCQKTVNDEKHVEHANRAVDVESKDSMTNTHYSDFLVLQKVNSGNITCNDVKIISCCNNTLQREVSRVVAPTVCSVTRKLLLDKSSMTDHEEIFTTFPETEFKELVRVFPAIPLIDLREIFEKCNRDVNWTVDVLLEMDYRVESEIASSPDLPLYDHASTQALTNDYVFCVPQSTKMDDEDRMSPGVEIADKTEKQMDDIPVSKWSGQETKRRDNDVTESVTAQELKQQIEKSIVLNEKCYSEHVLRIRKMRHGELLDMGELTTLREVDPKGKCDNLNTVEDGECDGQSAVGGSSDRTQESKVSTVNINNENEIQCGEAYVDMKLSEEFVSQLHSLFGASPHLGCADTSPTIKLPVAVALQIHHYLIKHEEDVFRSHQLKMIEEDERLAREIEENEVVSQKGGCPDLREIMDMEMALAVFKADKKQWCHGTPETLALKLRKSKLYEMFPKVSKELISNVFEASDHSVDDAVAILTALGSDAELRTTSETIQDASTIMQDSDVTNLENNAIGKDESILDIVKRYREEACHYRSLRTEFYKKAQAAFQKGMHSVAHYYSELARQHEYYWKEAKGCAHQAIDAVAPGSRRLDLHGLSVREAVCLLDSFLDSHLLRLRAAANPRIHLEVVTGRGKNSPRHQPRVRPAVLQRLAQRSLRCEEVNEGLFRITLNRNSVFRQ